MNGHECYIIGAGDFFGLREAPDDDAQAMSLQPTQDLNTAPKTASSPTLFSAILTRSAKHQSIRTFCSFP